VHRRSVGRGGSSTGYRDGREKACVIIIEYPLDSEKKRGATDSIQQAISTLKLKE